VPIPHECSAACTSRCCSHPAPEIREKPTPPSATGRPDGRQTASLDRHATYIVAVFIAGAAR
jgi:hypothetical protein